MNNLNYATLEASQKLHDAGITLETDWYWVKLITKEEWVLSTLDNVVLKFYESIPAPSMAELWRELPFQSYIKKLDDGRTLVWICDDNADGKYIESNMIVNINPTDALIDLLIWVKEQNKDRIVNKLLDRADKLKW